jgi:hypothetical protein
MKKLMSLVVVLALFAWFLPAMAGDTPKVFPVKLTLNGADTNSAYTALSDGTGYRQIERLVVLSAPSSAGVTGAVTFATAEFDWTHTNTVVATTIATSGVITSSGTFVTNFTSAPIGSLLKTTIVQTDTTSTNDWYFLIYAK